MASSIAIINLTLLYLFGVSAVFAQTGTAAAPSDGTVAPVDLTTLAAIRATYPYLSTHYEASFSLCRSEFTTCHHALAKNTTISKAWDIASIDCARQMCECLPSGEALAHGQCSYRRPLTVSDVCTMVESCYPVRAVCIHDFEVAYLPSECDAFRNCSSQPHVHQLDNKQCIRHFDYAYDDCDNTRTCSMKPSAYPYTAHTLWSRSGSIYVTGSVAGMALCALFSLACLRSIMLRRYRMLLRRDVLERRQRRLARLQEELTAMRPTRDVPLVHRREPHTHCDMCGERPARHLVAPCTCVLCDACRDAATTASTTATAGTTDTPTSDTPAMAKCPHCLSDDGVNGVVCLDRVYAESEECVICLDHAAEVLCVPCGHYATCLDCSRRVAAAASTCPLCRDTITTMCEIQMTAHHVDYVPEVVVSGDEAHDGDGNNSDDDDGDIAISNSPHRSVAVDMRDLNGSHNNNNNNNINNINMNNNGDDQNENDDGIINEPSAVYEDQTRLLDAASTSSSLLVVSTKQKKQDGN
eukprot:PhM_4_TR8345/c1_g1_i1/m.17834